MVHAQPVSVSAGKERVGRGHRTDHNAGQQLVQKQTAERQSRRGEGEVRLSDATRRRRLTKNMRIFLTVF